MQQHIPTYSWQRVPGGFAVVRDGEVIEIHPTPTLAFERKRELEGAAAKASRPRYRETRPNRRWDHAPAE